MFLNLIELLKALLVFPLISNSSNFNFSHRYSREDINSSSYRFTSNKILRFKKTLCLDIGIYISRTLIDGLRNARINEDEFIWNIILNLKKIYIWHNIQVRIKVLQKFFSNDPFSAWDTNLNNLEELEKYVTRESEKLDSYVYLKDINPPLEKQSMGLAKVGTICLSNTVAVFNIESATHGFNVLEISIGIAHEIGHNIGFSHPTDYKKCQCGLEKEYCVMYPLLYHNKKGRLTSFFDCHIEKLMRSLPRKNCLTDCEEQVNERKICGDGVVQEGEDCDCGFKELCELLEEDKCCDFETCKFKKNAQCSSGECCYNCKFTTANYCPNSRDECDGDSFCTGKSSKCTKKPNKPIGTLCNKGKSKCFGNSCVDNDHICKLYFTKDHYYSEKCNEILLSHIQSVCENKEDYYYDNMLCQNGLTICDFLVCRGPESFSSHLTFKVSQRGTTCFFYKPRNSNSMSIGAPNGIPCDGISDKICYNGKCSYLNNVLRLNESTRYLPTDFYLYTNILKFRISLVALVRLTIINFGTILVISIFVIIMVKKSLLIA